MAGAEREPGREPNDRRASQLRRAWDDLAAGDPVATDDLDPALIETVRRLLAADRRDAAPSPTDRFVRRLEEDLMQGTTNGTNSPTIGPPTPVNGRLPRLGLPHPGARTDRRQPSRFGAMAAAAVVLLTLTTALATFRLLPPSGDGGERARPAALGTQPVAGLDYPSAEECRVAPAPISRLFPAGTPTTVSVVPEGDRGTLSVAFDDLPIGPAASSATIAAVTATLRERWACGNARELARSTALYTDDFFRRTGFAFESRDELDSWGTPPADIEGWGDVPMPRIVDVQRLPDGRVRALALTEHEEEGLRDGRAVEGIASPSLLVFAQSSGRWLIDEELGVDAEPIALLPLAAPASAPKRFGIWEGDDLLLYLDNGSPSPSTVAIPQVGLERTVPPSGVAQLRLADLPAGEYRIVRTESPESTAQPDEVVANLVVNALPATATVATPSAGGEVTVELFDIGYRADAITIPVATDVAVSLVNSGDSAHTFVVDELGIDVEVPAHESRLIVVNAQAGSYAYYCVLPGHRAVGMVGTLTVE